MRKVAEVKDFFRNCFLLVFLTGFISLGAIGGCNDNNGAMSAFLGIHQTGQTTSYAPRDDGDLMKGIPPPIPRFTDNGDGTVLANLTGFLWTKDAGCV